MARRAYDKRDANERDIECALLEHGFDVRKVPPGAGYDLIAKHKEHDWLWHIEVKMPGGQMTKNELDWMHWFEENKENYLVMRTETDVRDAVKFARRGD